MIDLLQKQDFDLINILSSRSYKGNQLTSNASQVEIFHLNQIKIKLKNIAEYFKIKYDVLYGPFDTSVTKGNPLAYGGTNFKRVWSGIFKGTVNKQYSAQVSFVMNPLRPCLDVGFYFGRASGHSISSAVRRDLQSQLNRLGDILSTEVIKDSTLGNMFDSLFDYGFQAFSKTERINPGDWLNVIGKDPIAKLRIAFFRTMTA